jgi:hypothetical protein
LFDSASHNWREISKFKRFFSYRKGNKTDVQFPKVCWNERELAFLFFTGWICSREQKIKQLDWLAKNTDVITAQSRSLFACSRAKKRAQLIIVCFVSIEVHSK